MPKMTFKDFRPEGSTGENDNDMLYRSYITGPQGARYELFKEATHTDEDLKRAKKYLRTNFDVVSIHVIEELPPVKPAWLFVGVYTTCYIYADMRYEKNGDYKEICRLFYSPLRLEIMTKKTDKYYNELRIAAIELEKIKANIDKPIQISASGQTVKASL